MRLLSFILAVITTFSVFGADAVDSVKVYFHVGMSQFDPEMGDNGVDMERFVTQVREAFDDGDIQRIVVRAYASPDGLNKANQRLSVKRCKTITDYIAVHTGVSRSLIEMQPGGIAWDELRELVFNTPDVPSRDKVLDILDNTPVWVFDSEGKIIDGRKKQLMDLARGVPYRWMYTHLFPELRNAVAISLYTINPEKESAPESAAEPATDKEESQSSTATAESSESDASSVTDRSELSVQDSIAASSAVIPSAEIDVKGERKPFYFALKTNMLYDAALVPNLGIEFYLGKNLSLYGDWMHAWWSKRDRNRYYRIYGGELGLRWWFGDKAHEKPLTGHHAGIYAGAYTFDMEFGGRGYLGGLPGGHLLDRCFINAGLEYGYSLPVSKHFNIDFSIGIGYTGGKYMEYLPDGFEHGYLWQTTKRFSWIGPTKAEISLVWLLGRGNVNVKKGGEK